MKKILVVSPHPDDETLGCGGTLLKLKKQNYKIDWLIITSMSEDLFNSKSRLKRNNEIKKVKKMYNFNNIFNLNFPTMKLDQIPLREIIGKVSKVIKISRPNTIFTNFYGDVHSDHKIVFDVISSCTKNFRCPYVSKIFLYETLSETGYFLGNKNKVFIPNYFSDITKLMTKKIKIMNIYSSELMKGYMPRSIRGIKTLAEYRGLFINVKYAEAFMLVYEKD